VLMFRASHLRSKMMDRIRAFPDDPWSGLLPSSPLTGLRGAFLGLYLAVFLTGMRDFLAISYLMGSWESTKRAMRLDLYKNEGFERVKERGEEERDDEGNER
jgi:hypothetical protein